MFEFKNNNAIKLLTYNSQLRIPTTMNDLLVFKGHISWVGYILYILFAVVIIILFTLINQYSKVIKMFS